jgi:glycosyltransferase involved in cell wall biosynthesis
MPADFRDTLLSDEVWIVVPAYNEAPRLDATLERLCRQYHNIVVVDDGSTDATYTVASRHAVWLLRHATNCGQGAALRTGIEFALGHEARVIVTFDGDGQHSVEDIEALVRPVLRDEVDIVLGSRFLGSAIGIPFSRRVILKLGVLFTRLFSRIKLTDTHNGLRAMSAAAARRIEITHGGMAHASEFIDEIRRHRLRYEEVPVTVRYRDELLGKGQTSWNSLRIVGQLLLGRITR